MTSRIRIATIVACAGLTAPALGQDSVSNVLELPGDAVSPWQDGTSPDGSEQCNTYVVDLAPFSTCWGVPFGIAPIAKSSKTSSGFFSSLLSAQSVSHTLLLDVPYPSSLYDLWTTRGAGINNVFNNPGVPTAPPGATGNQFAFAFDEFANTETTNLIAGVANFDPADTSRLYVTRVVTAVNAPDDGVGTAAFGMGMIDASGNVHIRADGFGRTGVPALTGDNIFRFNVLSRDCSVLNVIDDTGASDTADRLLTDDPTTHSVPSAIPASIAGRPVYMGPDFATEYCYESAPSVLTCVPSPIGSSTDIRGAVVFSKAIAFAGTVGTDAQLSKSVPGGGATDTISLWGVDANGAPVGQMNLNLPVGTVTDPCDAFTLPSTAEYDHYHSQTGFNGGTGQIALGQDQQGRILAAAVVYNNGISTIDTVNSIAVARWDTATGTVDWTLAAWIDGSTLRGKPFTVSRGGAVKGHLVTSAEAFAVANISFSAPAMDSVGNIYFLAPYELDAEPGVFATGLFRAVYTADCDPVTPGDQWGYGLDLMLSAGSVRGLVATGANSATDYQIRFMDLFDGNSISSGTIFSGNIIQSAWNGIDPTTLDTAAPETLGGLVVNATISYDSTDGDKDGDGDRFNDFDPDPLTVDTPTDEVYNVLLFIGALGGGAPPCPADCDGDGDADVSDFFCFVVAFASGDPAADCDGDGDVDVSDFFCFVLAFSAGCP